MAAKTDAYRFIGKDHSMGFRHGATYRLSVTAARGMVHIKTTIFRIPVAVPYSSVAAFMRNWELALEDSSVDGRHMP